MVPGSGSGTVCAVNPDQHPLILGHRGASAYAADNTLAAFALAVSHDADGIELDVRRTRDGRLILHHDAGVEGVGSFVELTFDEVRASLPDVATPDEMLSVAGDLLLNVEIKNHPTDPDFDPQHTVADAVVGWVQRHQLQERTIVSSFNWDTVDRVRALDPSIPTGQLLFGSDRLEDHIDPVAARGHQWINPPDGMLGATPAAPIQAAHDHELRVMVWTVDDPARMLELAAAGIDAIITNNPELANEVLG